MFKATKQVIIPVFQLIENVALVVTFEGPFYVGEKVEKDKEPAMLAKVVNPATGEKGLIVANEVLHSTLAKEYPDNGYVGKTFEITKLPKREGKNYNGFKVNEGEYVADPTAPDADSSVTQAPTTAPDAVSPAPVDASKASKKK